MARRDPPSDDRTLLESYRATCLEWILLSGDRALLAAGFVAVFAAFFAALELLGVVPVRNSQALFYAFSGLIAGNLALITVVVSIDRLLRSRELQTPDAIESQIESVVEFRAEVEDAADEIAPVKPMGSLGVLVESTRGRPSDWAGSRETAS